MGSESTDSKIDWQAIGLFITSTGKILPQERIFFTCQTDWEKTVSDDEGVRLELSRETKPCQYKARGEVPIYHGESLRQLQQVSYVDENHFWGTVRTVPSSELLGRPSVSMMQPAMLDACWFACGIFNWLHDNSTCIPESVGTIRVGRATPEMGSECHVHIHMKSRKKYFATFDFTLRTPSGEIVLDVSDYKGRVL